MTDRPVTEATRSDSFARRRNPYLSDLPTRGSAPTTTDDPPIERDLAPPPEAPRHAWKLWIVLASVIAIIVVIAAAVVLRSTGNRGVSAAPPPAPESAPVSGKPDIAHLTAEAVIKQSAVPPLAGARWRTNIVENPSTATTLDPPECSVFIFGMAASEKAIAVNMAGPSRIGVQLALPREHPDLTALLQRCGSVTTGDGSPPNTSTFQALDVGNLPAWAVATKMQTVDDESAPVIVSIFGYYRGVLVEAEYVGGEAPDPSMTDRLARMFNAQIAMLEAA